MFLISIKIWQLYTLEIVRCIYIYGNQMHSMDQICPNKVLFLFRLYLRILCDFEHAKLEQSPVTECTLLTNFTIYLSIDRSTYLYTNTSVCVCVFLVTLFGCVCLFMRVAYYVRFLYRCEAAKSLFQHQRNGLRTKIALEHFKRTTGHPTAHTIRT